MSKPTLICQSCSRRVPRQQLYNKGKAIPKCSTCRQKDRIAEKVAVAVPNDDDLQFRQEEAARMMRIIVERTSVMLDPIGVTLQSRITKYKNDLKKWVSEGGVAPQNPMLD